MTPLHRLFVVVLGGAAMVLVSCDGGGTGEDPPEDTFDRPAMLANYADNVILPAYRAFQAEAAALQAATDAFAAAPSPGTLAAARQALQAAWLAWQDAAPFEFGPAETVLLRASLNTYPANTDQVEANVASGNYVLGSVANRAAGGLPALDYLLNGQGDTAEKTVARYTTDGGATQRLAYLQANAAFITANIDEVVDGWQPSGDDYRATFLSPARAGVDVGSSLGALSNALILHYERFVRDGKIGIPAGVRSAGVPRPATVEAFYGGFSTELALAGVRAVRRLYRGAALDGADGPGLDDNLVALGAADLDADIEASLTATLTALEGLGDPLSARIESDPDAVVAAFTTMQRLVALLKADLASTLGITITFQDNDGD